MKNLIYRQTFSMLLSTSLMVSTVSTQESMAAQLDDLLNMDLEELMEVKIVTIATGAKQTLTQAPAVATVITADDIEAIGATDLDEVLETVPGLHVARSQFGYDPIYTIRGIGFNIANPHVLMLINGIPFQELYGGGRATIWGGMPVNNIARIEILRGPGSAIFGADAFAGVINIITKTQADINGTETGVRVGRFDTQDAWILHGGSYHGMDLALALEYHDTEGSRQIVEEDAQTYYDHLFGTQASLAPGSVNLPRHNLDARFDVSRDHWQLRVGYQGRHDFGVGAGTAQALDPVGRFSDERFNVDLTYHNPKFSDHWDVSTQWSHLERAWKVTQNQTLFPPGAFGGAYPEGFIANAGVSERHSRLELSGFYSGFEKHSLRLGMGYRYGDLYKATNTVNFGIDPATGLPISPDQGLVELTDTPYSFIPTKTRKLWYAFLQDAYKFAPNWELTAGLRYDHYSDFGNTVNPRLALVWQTRPELTSKLLYGRAFRAPAFYELYLINNPVALGNPALQPETLEMWELAFDYRFHEKLRLSWNFFTYQIREAIQRQVASTKDAFSNQNAGQQKGRGLELEMQWQLSKQFNLTGNYAFQRSIDEKSDHDAGNTPHHQVYLRTDWQVWPKWFLDTQVNWVADRIRVSGDPRPPIDDYTTVDLSLRNQTIKDHLDLAVVVHNLFDTDAREPSSGPDTSGIIGIPHDLPLAGRNYFVEVRYRF